MATVVNYQSPFATGMNALNSIAAGYNAGKQRNVENQQQQDYLNMQKDRMGLEKSKFDQDTIAFKSEVLGGILATPKDSRGPLIDYHVQNGTLKPEQGDALRNAPEWVTPQMKVSLAQTLFATDTSAGMEAGAQIMDNGFQGLFGQQPQGQSQGQPQQPPQMPAPMAPQSIPSRGGSSGGFSYTGNIDLNNHPLIHLAGGGQGTIKSTAFTDEKGNVITVPTIYNGREHTPDEAVDRYYQTGQHLGIIKGGTPAQANAYGQWLHEQEAARTSGQPPMPPQQQPFQYEPEGLPQAPMVSPQQQPMPGSPPMQGVTQQQRPPVSPVSPQSIAGRLNPPMSPPAKFNPNQGGQGQVQIPNMFDPNTPSQPGQPPQGQPPMPPQGMQPPIGPKPDGPPISQPAAKLNTWANRIGQEISEKEQAKYQGVMRERVGKYLSAMPKEYDLAITQASEALDIAKRNQVPEYEKNWIGMKTDKEIVPQGWVEYGREVDPSLPAGEVKYGPSKEVNDLKKAREARKFAQAVMSVASKDLESKIPTELLTSQQLKPFEGWYETLSKGTTDEFIKKLIEANMPEQGKEGVDAVKMKVKDIGVEALDTIDEKDFSEEELADLFDWYQKNYLA